MELLPAHRPVPKLAGVYDDGDWIAVVLADVEGRHPQLSGTELHRVLDALDLAAAAADALRGDQLARVGDPGCDTEAALRQHRAFAGAPDDHIDAAQGAPRRTAGTRRRCSGKSPGWGKVSFVVPQERPRILDHPAAAVAQW